MCATARLRDTSRRPCAAHVEALPGLEAGGRGEPRQVQGARDHGGLAGGPLDPDRVPHHQATVHQVLRAQAGGRSGSALSVLRHPSKVTLSARLGDVEEVAGCQAEMFGEVRLEAAAAPPLRDGLEHRQVKVAEVVPPRLFV